MSEDDFSCEDCCNQDPEREPNDKCNCKPYCSSCEFQSVCDCGKHSKYRYKCFDCENLIVESIEPSEDGDDLLLLESYCPNEDGVKQNFNGCELFFNNKME